MHGDKCIIIMLEWNENLYYIWENGMYHIIQTICVWVTYDGKVFAYLVHNDSHN